MIVLKKEIKNEKSLKLFISIDIVSSKRIKKVYDFKMLKIKKNLKDLEKKYLNFIKTKIKTKYNCNNFRLWKFNGDEFIFVFNINRKNELYEFLNISYDFMKSFNKKEKKLFKIKTTSWITLIDNENNIQINLETFSNSPDYIGPGIDEGFRLTKLSEYNKFIVNYYIAKLLNEKKEFQKYIKFVGFTKLKGIIYNQPYPIFLFSKNAKKGVPYNVFRTKNINKSKRNIKKEDVFEYYQNVYSYLLDSNVIDYFEKLE